jgi:hypothetical protein
MKYKFWYPINNVRNTGIDVVKICSFYLKHFSMCQMFNEIDGEITSDSVARGCQRNSVNSL